jgi:hypothetical protein
MKSLIAPMAAFGLLTVVTGVAQAAPPAYCALYAREYANQFSEAAGEQPGTEKRIQDEAYYRCLNQDQDPQLPATSAYYGTDLDTGGQGGPLETAAASGNTVDVTADQPSSAAAPKPANTKQASNTPSKRYYGSGLQAWTPEWKAWCQSHFPNSFDEKTGMILPYNSNKPQFCK